MGGAGTLARTLRFVVRSRNGKAQHHLKVVRGAGGLRFTCTCGDARRDRPCQHRMTLVVGDETLIIGRRDHLNELLNMISETPLPRAVQELRRLERERDHIKEEIVRQERFIAELMSGSCF
jgi:hypothetical protein